MPKMKTHKGAAKRFRKSAKGKFRHKRGYANHLLTKKSAKRKRRLRKSGQVAASDEKQVRRLLPYS